MPRTVKVADLIPASSPCWMSSTSASNPSRSAHRVYMRRSISAQSWLSVPPAPALIVAIASEASYGPESSAASSSLSTSVSREDTAVESSFVISASVSSARSSSMATASSMRAINRS